MGWQTSRWALGVFLISALGCSSKNETPTSSSPAPSQAVSEPARAAETKQVPETRQAPSSEPYFVYVSEKAEESVKTHLTQLGRGTPYEKNTLTDQNGTRYLLQLTVAQARELNSLSESLMAVPIRFVQARLTLQIGSGSPVTIVRQIKNVLPVHDANLNDPLSYLFEASICQQVDSPCIRYLAERGVFKEALINHMKRDQWGHLLSERNAQQNEELKKRLGRSLTKIDTQLAQGVQKLSASEAEIIYDVSLKFDGIKVRWSKKQNVGLPISRELVVNAGTAALNRDAFIYNLGSDWAADLPTFEQAPLLTPKAEIQLAALKELHQALLEALR